MRRLILVLALGASVASVFAPSASASAWRVSGGTLEDGTSVAMVFAGDITTRSMIGLSCRGGRLRALAAPAPPGATGRVRVTYEIDGRSRSGRWTVEETRLVAEGDEARRFAALLAAMRREIWFTIGDGPRSLVSARGARQALARVLAECRPGS
ncbi:hypothetical protein [Enterovirga rhinocerotis]|uniref:Uncharacterized protein n=1 Tax=Enterovirga rhinocerotis TaxID=1339210 RepID=A0A4R7BUB8_9HYPH|nr:hypothetical protein [Enterovirga rhinocerotis]TDR88175.1 hypothetical protein EV668_4046 [Enterovirga rhinocerotis]